jgi:hypothetical protein
MFYNFALINARQMVSNVNEVYGPNTLTAIRAKFWYLRFRSCIYDGKDYQASMENDRRRPA